MSVPDQPTIFIYTGNGVTDTFAYGFYLLSDEDIVVALDGVEQTIGFTVNGVGSQSGGAVIFGAAPAAGVQVQIYRQVAVERNSDYQRNGDLRSDDLNRDFDRLWMALQDNRRDKLSSIRYPIAENLDGELPGAGARALMLLGFDSLGHQMMTPFPTSIGAGDMRLDTFAEGVDFTAGVSTQLTLSRPPGNPANLEIFFDAFFQGPDQWGVAGSLVTFSSPIPVGVSKVFARIGTTLSTLIPSDDSVGDDQLTWSDVLSRVVDSVAELRALNKTRYTRATLTGYYTAGDGGGGEFWLDAADATTADNGGTVIVGNDGGRWKLRHSGILNVKQFGAQEGGDLYTPLTRLIAVLTALNGGLAQIPPSTQAWQLSGTININASDIKIEGAGHGKAHDTGSALAAATVIQWTGASGGTMFDVRPTGARTLQGCGIVDVYLDGNPNADYGVRCYSSNSGIYRIAGAEFGLAMFDMGCVVGLSEAADVQHNTISLWGRQLLRSGSILACGGISNANTSFNTFPLIVGQYNDNPSAAIYMATSDNNVFEQVHLVRAGGGTGRGLMLDASTFTVPAASNMFYNLSPGNGGVYAAGTERFANPSVYNEIVFYDSGNGPPAPVTGTGVILYWATNQAPVGMRNEVVNPGTTTAWHKDSGGRIVVMGKSSSVGAASTLFVGAPAGVSFATGPYTIQLTPVGASVAPYSAQWTGTGININNGSATPTDFWYRYEGY